MCFDKSNGNHLFVAWSHKEIYMKFRVDFLVTSATNGYMSFIPLSSSATFCETAEFTYNAVL